jgi:hypothetical protein
LPPWLSPPGEIDDWLESEADRPIGEGDPVTASRLQREVRFPARETADGTGGATEKITRGEG